MIKKTIKFTDYNDQEVEEDFYFNFTKLELLEKELEFGGIEDTIKRLTVTEQALEAYEMFKALILAGYGVKSADGKTFRKTDENGRRLSRDLEESPALSELIMEFLQDPEAGAQFMAGTLPSGMAEKLAADDAAGAKVKEQIVGDITEAITTPVAPVEEKTEEPAKKSLADYTKDELLAMPQIEFNQLAGTDPTKMDKSVLQVAFLRKTSGV